MSYPRIAGGFALAAAIMVASAGKAGAELETVQVGGQITTMGEYYTNIIPSQERPRWSTNWLTGRPVGTSDGIFGGFGGGEHSHGLSLVSQWTRLNVKALFSEHVSALIELDSVSAWGDSFRSDYLTGTESRPDGAANPDVYQAYVEAEELLGAPLRLRIGRQEMRLGNEWLVGANDDGPAPSWGLSFDALRLTFALDDFSIDAWSAKLAERSPAEQDGDADFHGLYASYLGLAEHLGLESMTCDAYWLYLRDAATEVFEPSSFGEWVTAQLGGRESGKTKLHTVGLRAAGNTESFDFDVECARQFGDAGQVGTIFRPVVLGDSEAEYDVWGCNVQGGLTLSAPWQPRAYAGYAFFEGEDNRDISFPQWIDSLVNPFYTPSASISFNRLFSNHSYSAILDGTDLSNVHAFHVGVEAAPSEKVDVAVDLGYYRADEVFHRPVLPLLSFLSAANEAELGWEIDTNITYHLSDSLQFCAGWDHLFVGDGLKQGNYTLANGLDYNGWEGSGADYWYFETGLSF